MTTDTGQTVATDTGTTATTTQTQAVDVSWLGTDAKPEITSYVQNKGFKGPTALAEAYINAEKALSSRPQFEMPKPEDKEGRAKIFAALGVPEGADKYELGEVAKAMKPEALKEWTGVLHKHNLTNEQAQGLVAEVLGMSQKQQEAAHNAYVEKTSKDAERLKLEMGDKWPAYYDIAQRGFDVARKQLGLTDEQVDGLERTIGTKALFALGHLVGEAKVEAGFVASDGQHRGMTKDQARAAINGFKADPAKSRALMRADDPGHAAALSEWQQLRRIAEA